MNGNPVVASNPKWVKPLWFTPPPGKSCMSCDHFRTAGQPNQACAERPVVLLFEMEGGEKDENGVYHVEGLPQVVVISDGCASYLRRADLAD